MLKIHLFIRKIGILPYLIFLIIKSIISNLLVFGYCKLFVYRNLRYLKLSSFQKKSDTIFLLGSGSSVNDLTSENWAEINKKTSIGFNFWIVNKFVPDFLFIEPAKDYRGLLNIIEESKKRYKDVIFVIKGVESFKFQTTIKLIRSIKKGNHQIFFAQEIGLPSFNVKDLTSSLRIIKNLGLLKTNILAQSRSSIFLLIYYSIIKGYKRIVLSGVDLCGPYFYEDKTNCLYSVNTGQKNTDLKINSKSKNLIDTESAILALNNELGKHFEFKIFVSSEKSKLSRSFDVYKFI